MSVSASMLSDGSPSNGVYPQARSSWLDPTEPAQALVAAVRGGDRRGLARLMTAIERGSTEARQALAALYPATGKAHRIGVTGPPGSGKSTLVAQLARQIRAAGRSVGIIAVDPTSPFSGGAILGDRIRMQDLHSDPGVFIRSVATRGALGGLARSTADMADALDAFGNDVVVIETVGVGQDEVEIARAADTTVVVEVPGLGDDVQALKAGLLEIADIFVVNKADRPNVRQVVAELRAMLSLGPKQHWQVPVLQTVAIKGEGVVELLAALDRHRAHLDLSGERQARRAENARQQVMAIVEERVRARLDDLTSRPGWVSRLQELAARESDPYALADQAFKELAGRQRG